MSSGIKEDEKNEKIIRGLLKQPGNRKCINCNVLGPQYVCTTFSTFICTTCGGIHREFTHRVKSVSMAKFTPQEIASLQAGGNERAKEIYFKDWDPQRHPAPDSSNVDRLRTFIKHVYVDRRYAGERSIDRPPRVKLGDKEESSENRKSDPYQSGSRSPPYDDAYDRRYRDRGSPGYDVRRSPGYDQDNQKHSDFKKSPVRSGIVNDWRREDRFSDGRRSEDRRSSDGDSKPEIKSPDSQKGSSTSSPPIVRPVRDILGDNVVPLRISEPPRANSGRVADGPTITQRTASSSSLASSNGNPTELTRETSLIDFDAEPEPPVTAAATEGQQSTAGQPVAPSTRAPTENSWACFDSVPDNKPSQAPPSSNPLESMLMLSVPAPTNLSGSTSNGAAPMPSNGMFTSSTSGDLLFGSLDNTSTTTLPANGGTAQWSGMQSQQQPSTLVAANQLTGPLAVSAFPSGSSSQGVTGNPVAQAPQAIPAHTKSTVKANFSGMKELPADIFTATYPSVPYQAHGWHAGLAPGMVYPMQYAAMAMPTLPQPTKAFNPFDANPQASSVPAAAFPSMSSLHASLPNMAHPGGSVHSPNLGGATPSWMSPQLPSYPSAVPPAAPSFGSAMPGTYMGQQPHSNMTSSRPQGFGSFGSGASFGSNPAAATPNPSLGGNPFG